MAESSSYNKEQLIPWDEVDALAHQLADDLEKRGPWQAILAVQRGGVIPAALIARKLGIPYIETIAVASYDGQKQGEISILKSFDHKDGEGLLIIDDLVDTGKTFQFLRKLYPKAFFAALYAKPKGEPLCDLFIKKSSQDTWLTFPWEVFGG